MSLLVYGWLVFKAALFSSSGTGNLPMLHHDLTGLGWATERQFAESLTIGQLSPGPTGLWVISLGYLMYGWAGAILTLVAISLPPMLVLIVERVYRKVGHHAAVVGFVRGLSLAVVGIFFVVLGQIQWADGFSRLNVSILIVSLALAATRRVLLVAIIGMAAVVGVVSRSFG